MTNVLQFAGRVSPPTAQTKPGKRAMRVNPQSAIRCSAAFDQIAAAIRALDEYGPTSGIVALRSYRDALWAQLPKIEALAVLVENEALAAMNAEDCA